MGALAFMVMMSVMIISGRSIRKNELQKTLDYAAEQALEHLLKEKNSNRDSEEFIGSFVENLSAGIESDSEILISIMGIDTEKGVLSVKAEEEFWHPLGKKGKVEAEKTVIIEQYNIARKELCTVCYKIKGSEYKSYSLTKGSIILFPFIEETDFLYWIDEKGQKVEEGEEIIITADRKFDAVMK